MSIKLLYIGNGSGLVNVLSGGAVKTIELFKRWPVICPDLLIKAWVTIGGYEIFKNHGLKINYKIIKSSVFAKRERFKFQRALSYIISTIHSVFECIRLKEDFDIVYTGSDFFCDIIPAFFIKVRQPCCKWVCTIHHRYQKPGIRKGNYLFNLLGWLTQRLSFKLIIKKTDLVFVYDTDEGDQIRKLLTSKGMRHESIKKMYNGINVSLIKQMPEEYKKFDCCFIGGLRPSKGVKDFVPIWGRVVKSQPTAKLVLIGYYDKLWGEYFLREIRKNGLSGNIILTGYVSDEDKYRYLKSSKVYISPSYEEGWGIAIFESLACGIPVIAYDLSVYHRIFDQYITFVPKGDCSKFARCILEELNNNNVSRMKSIQKDVMERYDWDNIARDELEEIQLQFAG